MISKTKISKRLKRKTNPKIVETIELAKKNNHLDLAKRLSGPTRLYKKVNVGELNKLGDKIIVVGKVLGQGEINKKISVGSLGFSEQAKEKLKGSELMSIKQMIEKNKGLDGVEII